MPDTLRESLSLQLDEFFLLLAAHRKPKEMPSFLGVNPAGRNRTERAKLTAVASEALAERGLGTIAEPDPDLLDAVHLMATAPVRIEFGVIGADETLWSVAAVDGPYAAVATRTPAAIHVWNPDRADVLSSLIDTAPDVPAGQGAVANIPAADFDRARDARAADDSWAVRDAIRDAGVHDTEQPTIERAIEDGPGGILIATDRDDAAEDGYQWRAAPAQLSWVDTSSGRYAIRNDGEWVTVTPADNTKLYALAVDIVAQVDPED